jgi:hypothetical protein
MSESNQGRFTARLVEGTIDYTGAQLRSHFIREAAGIVTDGAIAFIGRCDVSGDRLVDLEDASRGETIVAERMLHFIGEQFQCGLREANARLRLFAAIVAETLGEGDGSPAVVRDGDDLFIGDRKLTVAIATASPVSALFHFGVNIDPAGAPVPAVGLAEIGIEARGFARSVLARYAREHEQIELAMRKVRGVP